MNQPHNVNTTILSGNNNGIRIDYLANHSAVIPELSTLLYNEWADLYQAAGLTKQDLITALELRCATNQLPLTLVAVAADASQSVALLLQLFVWLRVLARKLPGWCF